MESRTPNAAFTLLEIMIVVAIIGLLVVISAPAFVQYRADSEATLCVNNLRLMAHAKRVAALANDWDDGTSYGALGMVYRERIAVYLELEENRTRPVCPTSGNESRYNAIGSTPACRYRDSSGAYVHVLVEPPTSDDNTAPFDPAAAGM